MPIEVKASKTYNSNFSKNIKVWQDLVGTSSTLGLVIYNGEDGIGSSEKIKVRSAQSLLSIKGDFLELIE